jgi:SAM-dependent methyltransferase
MADQPTDARERLRTHFQAAKGTTEHGRKWDELYAAKFAPWDKGFPNPALVDLLDERSDLFPFSPGSKVAQDDALGKSDGEKKGSIDENGTGGVTGTKRPKALVPGCGKGYDVLLLAAHGYDAYGLEISPNALEEARKLEKEMVGKEIYKSKVEGGSVTWVSGDFFEDGFLKDVNGEGKFDLIYDYTVS